MMDMGFFFLLALIILFSFWCGLGIRRRPSPVVLWSTSVLTVVMLILISVVFTWAAKSAEEAIVLGQVFMFLLLALAFTFPLALMSWTMKLRKLLAVDRKKASPFFDAAS